MPWPSGLVVKNGSNALLDHLRRHAGAGIADRQHHVLSRGHLGMRRGVGIVEMRVRRFDGQLAAVRHRIARIDREIEQHVLELVGVHPRLPQPAGQHGLDRDHPRPASGAAGPTCWPPGVRHRAAPDRAAAGARTPAAGASASRRAARRPSPHRSGACSASLPARQAALQQLDVAADHRQVVVEVVRDAAGQPARPPPSSATGAVPPRPSHADAPRPAAAPACRSAAALAHRQQAEREQAQRCGNAEDQMRRHLDRATRAPPSPSDVRP